MNIREISDEDLSQWIAEKLEPRATAKYGSKYWRLSCHVAEMSAPALEAGATAELLRLDMVNDPAMRSILEESLLDHGHSILVEKDGHKQYRCSCQHMDTGFVSSLGRALAEYFALANGWPQ